MANYRKSFNLRNGVQVDDNNFIVNANGLVGIGTSIPSEKLDVRGNLSVSGLINSSSIRSSNLNVIGISTINLLNVGITSITSGVITSTNPGVNTVKYYGDGSGLTNIPTSQWVNVNVGLGFSSIYASGTVGIATNAPLYYLQIGQSPDFGNGVGINSTGGIKASGIITAGSFDGNGSSLTGLNASNISSGTLSNSRLPSNISVSGIITAATFNGNLSGTAALASNLTGSPSINVSDINASNINLTGIITTTYINSSFSATGISTASTRLYAELIGVGTNSPSSDIHIRRTNSSTLQITSDSAEAIVAIGRSTTLTGSNGALRFGNTNPLYPYSTTKSLDIINYDSGNINNYLQLGSSGIGTGSFNWIYGKTLSNLMTLTYNGNLGIGITIPTNTLHVVGTSTVTNNVYAGVDIYAGNNLYVGNDLNVTGSFSATSVTSNLIGNVTGNLTGNVYAASGVSTFTQTRINNRLGIGTDASLYQIEIGISPSKVLISNSAIGINTTTIANGAGLDCVQSVALFKGVGVGTTSIASTCYVDFSNAGGMPGDIAAGRYMLPPKLTTTQRDALVNRQSGAFIYNISVNRMEYYNGSGWCGIATVAGA